MKLNGITRGVLAVALTAAFALAGASGAQAATPQPSGPEIPAAAQAASEAAVAAFTATNTAPVLAATASDAQFLAFSQDLQAYWKKVPWSDVYGQWGCTVSNIQIDFHSTSGAWGTAGTEMSSVEGCPGASHTHNPLIGKVAARTSLTTATSPTAPATTSLAIAPTPNLSNCALSGTGNYICIGTPSVGVLEGENQNQTSVLETGHIRLGNPGIGGACGLVTFIGNGPTVTLGNSQWATYSHSISMSSYWSAIWYDPNEAAIRCGNY
ncbi:MAG: hypothetical protein QOH55_696 [Microbacteriaceae bacterium]|nr:hypothetical protein [Microbacteriaceae bacterium]